MQHFGRKSLNKETLRRPVTRYDDIKLHLKEARWKVADRIRVTQDKDQR
jgi:hypothetical protein